MQSYVLIAGYGSALRSRFCRHLTTYGKMIKTEDELWN